MLALALWLKKNGFRADQVQTFLPSPMATATAMYHTGQNPLRKLRRRGGETVAVPKGLKVRRLHKAFLRYHDPAELAAPARGAAPDGPRRPDRQRPPPAGPAARAAHGPGAQARSQGPPVPDAARRPDGKRAQRGFATRSEPGARGTQGREAPDVPRLDRQSSRPASGRARGRRRPPLRRPRPPAPRCGPGSVRAAASAPAGRSTTRRRSS